ncbi:MAG: DNA-3-methyladenine glycosylase 2 family protein [Oscillospiraceae bacterium]|jgi:N-glycosylase/DNA lyase|nr:DNA-3-methyladenine glycosylase 2 family protein [Oscillospiraceae bacterium]
MGTLLSSCSELNIEKTFECGQCFRWNPDDDGGYFGVASARTLRVWNEGEGVFCSASPEELPFWRDYFDLDSDYPDASVFREPKYLACCAEYGAGIRILRQEPWEALCSFIISQCNNIPRIKGIVERLCALFGDELSPGVFSFPEASRLAPLEPGSLAQLRCGYRARYIIDAARAVDSGELSFDELRTLSPKSALHRITYLNGVGVKVASCFLLYGLHMMESFPIDVWMARALREHFPPDFSPESLGSYAGLAQQYIFYYARSSATKQLTLPPELDYNDR